MGSMYLEPSTPTADTDRAAVAPHSRNRSTAATPLVPSETLASLSGSSLDIVEKLLQPGVLIAKKSAFLPNKPLRGRSHKPKARILMPGTLNTPSPNTSLSGTTHNTSKDTIAPVPSGTPPLPSDERPDVSQTPSANLARTMSAAEREAFISTLASTSKATIHLLHKADLAEALTSATNFGFHARIVMKNDESDAHGFLILGRDEPKVLELTRRVENESRNAANSDGSERETGGALRAAAGGVVLGAVGAWAGLAFS
ncbi:hypothetical protein BD779DRAFT_1667803 [Infundibulicybe gibba]|nr:hypothetical protein BD779DRAFT_1667803 [Infundibulicybe gibba]